MTTPITLSGLTKRFGATTAVDDVSLTVERGRMFFLLGPSGCGKTTLLRMIAGFTEPTAGSIRFGARDVTRLPPDKRNAGMVFQSYALWPHMTVRENVEFGLKARKVPRDQRKLRTAQALALVQMEPYAERKPGQLSGGQQQRVALARALVVEPDVLLLDEPLSNLDAKLRHDMRAEIKRACAAAGVTAVYVTHDQKEALSMADEMAVMADGRVLQRGEPRTLYERPATRFVANFLGPTNFIDGEIIDQRARTLTIRTPAGDLAASIPDGAELPNQKNVTCLLRPEVLSLANGHSDATPTLGATGGLPARASDAAAASSTATAPSPPNTLHALYHESVYLGEMTQHTVELRGATSSPGATPSLGATPDRAAAGVSSMQSGATPSGADRAAAGVSSGVAASESPPPAHDTHIKFFEFNPGARLRRGEPVLLHVDPANVVVLTK